MNIGIIALIFGCTGSTPMSETVTGESGQFSLGIRHNDEERTFILYVPDSYDGSEAVPLFFNFHGFGGTSEGQMAWADMRPVADAENFILVYPQGTNLDGEPHWNTSALSEDNKSTADDHGFITYLIDQIGIAYSVDTTRVYAAGYSNGGFFSYSLGCFLGAQFAAIGSVSGTMLDDSYQQCEPTHPMGMINIHGTRDGVVPYDGGQGYTPIPDVVSWWVDYNGAQTTPVETSSQDGGTTIERYSYPAGETGVAIEHYKVINGDHVWFDEEFEGSSLGQVIWDYVSQYDTSGHRGSE